ncbi:hypothetical protein DYH09_25305 [bacterium CPR1]|nr:hypothetical protein [bacterium CPR1]
MDRARLHILLACLCAVVVVVAQRSSRPEPSAALLAGLSVVLAVASVRLPEQGFYSAFFGPALALALTPGGPLLALIAVVGGLALRAALRPAQLGFVTADLLAGLASLAALSVVREPALRPVLALAVYLPLAWRLPTEGIRSSAWIRHWEMIRLLLGFSALLGVSVALLGPPGYWLLLAFPGLQLLAAFLPGASAQEEREAYEQYEEQTRAALMGTCEELNLTGQAHQLESREREILQGLSARLAGSPDLATSLEMITSAVRHEIDCQSVAIFLAEESRLVPRGFRTPFASRLEGEARLQDGEPIVEECWRTGAVTAGSGRTLFTGEQTAVAMPLPGQGVLYVGRPASGSFGPDERRLLIALAGAAGLGIQSARRFEGQRVALELHERAHAKLAVWAERLAFLLQGARSLSADLNRQQVLERTRRLLETTLPHEAGAILLFEPETRVAWPTRFGSPAVEEVSRLVSFDQKPLLVEARAQFRGPDLGMESFIACPIGKLGTILLACSRTAFTREQQDILELIAFQAEVAFQNAALHQQLRSSQARLVHSSKLAAVGQLAAGVAHELNTPLCAAQVALEMAALDEDPAALDAHLAEAEEAEGRCRDIIQKLLYFARRSQEPEATCDLNQVVRDTLELLGHQLSLDGVQLRYELGELPVVRADSRELQQVVTALLLNAREAALDPAAHSREIRLVTKAFPTSVGLLVADRGPGVEPELRDRIFDPFFTTRPVGRGAGLGLSVSRQILSQFGATLELVETAGPGASFRVDLPLPPAPALAG